jgi:hypothetical protein
MTPYDASDLSFNNEDQTSILSVNNSDILKVLNSKADNTQTNVKLSILQASIDTKVQISTVDINNRFKILTSTDHNFQIQRNRWSCTL